MNETEKEILAEAKNCRIENVRVFGKRVVYIMNGYSCSRLSPSSEFVQALERLSDEKYIKK